MLFFLFLLPLHFVSAFTASPDPPPFGLPGHADECDALLQFSNSLTINTRIESRFLCKENRINDSSRPRTVSWKNGSDCCTWDGITCDSFTRNVVGVNLTCSYLQGTLHSNSTLFSLRYIELLHLGGNNLSGQIPTSICQKRSLVDLSLSDNKLSGTIPPCLGNLSNLVYLGLSLNHIQGELPRSLENCTVLEHFAVADNEITDTFPLWLKSLPLKTLQLSENNFHGSIEPNPTSFPFTYLVRFLLGPNNLSGRLPPDYFLGLLNLSAIVLSFNSFDGNMPIPPPTATFYAIGNNRFTGHIPSLMCNAIKLFGIEMNNNSLTGNIPQCLLNVLTDLVDLDLAMNKFRGPIPEIYAPNNCSLKNLDLSKNQLTGTLPRSLARCKSLGLLDLSGNEIEDSFPNWLETLPTLYILTLRSNKFHGPISSPLTIHRFPKLHIFDVSGNNFSGAFPTQYFINFREMAAGDKGLGDLQYDSQYVDEYSVGVILKGAERQLPFIPRSFMSIDISCNSFQGEIPEDIGNLRSLMGLNVSHNKLTGSIPSSLGNLTYLESLDLSSNDLTGQIPRALADLPYVEMLNLSNNQLTGPIPQGRQFNTFKSDSFSGNPGLCGPPLTRTCEVNPTPSSTPAFQEDAGLGSWIEWKAVLMGCVCGLALGISAGYMALQTGRPLWLMRLIENIIDSLQTRARRTRGRECHHRARPRP